MTSRENRPDGPMSALPGPPRATHASDGAGTVRSGAAGTDLTDVGQPAGHTTTTGQARGDAPPVRDSSPAGHPLPAPEPSRPPPPRHLPPPPIDVPAGTASNVATARPAQVRTTGREAATQPTPATNATADAPASGEETATGVPDAVAGVADTTMRAADTVAAAAALVAPLRADATPTSGTTARRTQPLPAGPGVLRTGPPVVAFLSGKGGTGTTITAAGVACALAAQPDDTVVLVDVQAERASLGVQLLGHRAPRLIDVTRAGTPALGTPIGPSIVDAMPPYDSPPAAELDSLLAILSTRHTYTLLDLGNDRGARTDHALRRADRVVVVTGTGCDALDATQLVLARLAATGPALLPTAIVAVVCPTPASFRRVTRRVGAMLPQHGAHIVPVPYDRELARGRLLASARLSPTTRAAYSAVAELVRPLAGHLVGRATG